MGIAEMDRGKTRWIWITGVGTSVGKTVFTALWTKHLLAAGHSVLAVKPFCSGGTTDMDHLKQVQPGFDRNDLLTPFYFEEPLAPWVAGIRSGAAVSLEKAQEYFHKLESLEETILVEGAGGALVPLGQTVCGKAFTLVDLILQLGGKIVVIAVNRLGVLHDSYLLLSYLREKGIQENDLALVLREEQIKDLASEDNFEVLGKMNPNIVLECFPFCGDNPLEKNELKIFEKKIKKPLVTLEKWGITKTVIRD